MACFLLAGVLQVAEAQPKAVRYVDIGRFIQLSVSGFQGLASNEAYSLTSLQAAASSGPGIPLGMTLAAMCYEELSAPGSWKSAGGSPEGFSIRGSVQDFQPVDYTEEHSDIVSAFYSFDGTTVRIRPFHLGKDAQTALPLAEVSGGVSDLGALVATIARSFKESLLGRTLSEAEQQPPLVTAGTVVPPATFKQSSRLEWDDRGNFQTESKKFSSALSRFVVSLSLSALSAGTYFLYSEAYSRSAVDIGKVYASGGAAVVFVAASAAFAVESIIRLARLLRYTR